MITVADAADMPSLDAAFTGTVQVVSGNLTFTTGHYDTYIGGG